MQSYSEPDKNKLSKDQVKSICRDQLRDYAVANNTSLGQAISHFFGSLDRLKSLCTEYNMEVISYSARGESIFKLIDLDDHTYKVNLKLDNNRKKDKLNLKDKIKQEVGEKYKEPPLTLIYTDSNGNLQCTINPIKDDAKKNAANTKNPVKIVNVPLVSITQVTNIIPEEIYNFDLEGDDKMESANVSALGYFALPQIIQEDLKAHEELDELYYHANFSDNNAMDVADSFLDDTKFTGHKFKFKQ